MRFLYFFFFLIICLPQAHGQMAIWEASETGFHFLSGEQIITKGILAQGDSLNFLRVVGSTQGTLSESNAETPTVPFVPYFIVDADGLLDTDSKIYFYVGPPHNWEYEGGGSFRYSPHFYSTVKYFGIFAVDSAQPSVPSIQYALSTTTPRRTLSKTVHGAVIDEPKVNLVSTGRRWFGDSFGFTKERTYTFDVPTFGGNIHIRANAVARSSTMTSFGVQIGNEYVSASFQPVSSSSYANYVTEANIDAHLGYSQQSSSVAVKVSYDQNNDPAAAMWLDKIVVSSDSSVGPWLVNYPRSSQDTSLIVAESQSSWVYEVTDPANPRAIATQAQTATTRVFYSPEDIPRTYMIPENATEPEFVRISSALWLLDNIQVENVIVSHANFMPAAQRLAALHNDEGVPSLAVEIQDIYDAFNGGTPDLTAIKSYMRYLSDQDAPIAYLTLFGDASYDFLNTLPNESNFVPTFQSFNSFNLNNSFITDDYFGYLDEDEGTNWFSVGTDLDLGVGRLPVNTLDDAHAVVDKIQSYLNHPDRFGPWRQNTVLVTDDADLYWESEFVRYQDQLAKKLDTSRPELNLIKIYSDAFSQESKPGSQRYPDARTALFRSVEQGALAVSYVGHGGEVGWATERILQLEDIQSWSNSPKLPVFTTITCEFTRFDDPNRVSAGEQLFLNPEGGAIALFSTTRSVIATNSTYALNDLLNEKLMFASTARLGDILRETKNENNSGDRIKFALIGDPAMRISRPKYEVAFDTINGVPWDQFTDTLKALSWVKISGHIADGMDNAIPYNGKVWVSFYDKAQSQSTLQNDGVGAPYSFKTQNNAAFRGTATVVNGWWSAAFRVPLDINLSVGFAKISAYATDSVSDAWGASSELKVGGVFEGIVTDSTGPEVRLYIDDTTFQSGGITDPNPNALGLLYDESGINAVGLGIGHNLTLTLDGISYNANEFYQSNLDDFTRGQINYPFYQLTEGPHTLELRAWDVLNQWGYDSIQFIVVDSQSPELHKLLAFPNPFTQEVHFAVNHNQAGEEGTFLVELLDNTGKVIWTKSQSGSPIGAETSLPSFSKTESLRGPGFYYVRVRWQRQIDGKSVTIQEKLIYIR